MVSFSCSARILAHLHRLMLVAWHDIISSQSAHWKSRECGGSGITNSQTRSEDFCRNWTPLKYAFCHLFFPSLFCRHIEIFVACVCTRICTLHGDQWFIIFTHVLPLCIFLPISPFYSGVISSHANSHTHTHTHTHTHFIFKSIWLQSTHVAF